MGPEAERDDGVVLRGESGTPSRITVGLGWDPNVAGSIEFDLDASAIAVTAADLAPSPEYFVYFNHLSSPRGELRHRGDNLTGDLPGDDEQIDIDLDRLSRTIVRIVFAVTIYDAEFRRQSFGDVRNAYIRVLETDSGTEIARYDLTTDAATETAMLYGEVCRAETGWRFRPLGEGRVSGLTGIAREYGVFV